jgi:hypothetical protein
MSSLTAILLARKESKRLIIGETPLIKVRHWNLTEVFTRTMILTKLWWKAAMMIKTISQIEWISRLPIPSTMTRCSRTGAAHFSSIMREFKTQPKLNSFRIWVHTISSMAPTKKGISHLETQNIGKWIQWLFLTATKMYREVWVVIHGQANKMLLQWDTLPPCLT